MDLALLISFAPNPHLASLLIILCTSFLVLTSTEQSSANLPLSASEVPFCLDKVKRKTYFINSFGNVFVRKRIYENLLDLGFLPETIISSKAYLSPSATIGKGVLIYPHCSISYKVKVENNVLINFNSSISHGVEIGENSNICPGVNISGNVKIGKNVFVGIGTQIREKVSICDHVFLGANSTVLGNIEHSGVYYGSPCRFIKDLDNV